MLARAQGPPVAAARAGPARPHDVRGESVTGILRVPRRGGLAAITVLVAAAPGVSFAESYRGLYD